MPNGKVHALATAGGATVLVAAAVVAAVAVDPACVGLALGAGIGHILTPDIDHHQTTHEERRIYRWNKLAGVLWWAYWTPYQWRRPHRGVSHSWPIGTLERFLYLLWLPLIASFVLVGGVALLFWVCVFVGQSVQDVIHIAMDNL